MRILGKITYGIFMTLLAAVAGLLLVSLVPITGNIEIKIVKSGSMEPAIKTGSLVVVKPSASYAVGDVITFGKDTAREIPTTHRITSIRQGAGGPYYSTKGDANEEADPKETAARDVVGKMLVTVPYAGYLLDFARQPMGFALLIGIPAGIIVMNELANIFKEVGAIRRRRREKSGGAMLELEVPQKPLAVAERARPRVFRERIPTI